MEGKKRTDEGDGAQKVDLSGMSLESLLKPSLNLAGITKLDLSNNNLESISESLMAPLLNVVVLDIQSNQLQSLPNSIGCLSKLKVLYVSGNLIESLLKSIEDCRALEELIANFNKLSKLLEKMGFQLTNLKKLCVNSNRLAFLPNSIHLIVLNVSQNFHYLNSLPYSIGLLVSLSELDISYNRIAILPDSIVCLTNLRKLEAVGNPLMCPPMEVVEQSVEAVWEYLSARMNGSAAGSPATLRRGSWIGKLVRCGTFNGAMISQNGLRDDNNNGFLLSEYRPLVGLATPRHVGMFSPRRHFFPRRFSA